MPAAYDIYSDQLRELRRGQPLYYPEPSEEGPVEIGDVGYTRQGAFCRLFNVARSGDDPAQILGVPEGFQPLVMGRILSYDAALEPGPLHSKTVFRVNADVGTNGTILPVDASFRFSCTSSRGAILMLETQMSRHQALHDNRFKNYLLQHCLSWYAFARELGVQVEFGDVMLVTECSKTSAWASAVYSQSSREFGMSFSAGGTFLPSAPGASISAGIERIGPVEYRRSQRRAITLVDGQDLPKDHTVFIRGYRLGSRSLYLRSLARKIMKTTHRTHQGDYDQNSFRDFVVLGSGGESSNATSHLSTSRHSQPTDSASELLGSVNASAVFPEWPDFHPAIALLAHEMETTDVEISAVHDDEWCSSYSGKTTQIIDDYVQCLFNENFLQLRERIEFSSTSTFSLTRADQTVSMNLTQEVKNPYFFKPRGNRDAVSFRLDPFQFSVLDLSDGRFQYLQKQDSGVSPAVQPFFAEGTAPSLKHDNVKSLSAKSPDAWSITLLGDGGVGKTALAYQDYDPTIEDRYKKKLAIDRQDCYLDIVDTAGQEEYRAMTGHWIRHGQAFVIVYSISSRSTFERIGMFLQLLISAKLHRHVFVLVANKIDQVHERQVSTEEGEKLAQTLGCEYIEASAKTAAGVQRVFSHLIRVLRGTKPMFPGGKAEKWSTPSELKSPQLHADSERKNKSCILM